MSTEMFFFYLNPKRNNLIKLSGAGAGFSAPQKYLAHKKHFYLIFVPQAKSGFVTKMLF
jgi:hypothetical protein